MNPCVLCGGDHAVDQQYARVRIQREPLKEYRGRSRLYQITETMTDAVGAAVCPQCEKKAKRKAVLMTVPITIVMTIVLTLLSFFVAKPNRNIRKEVASLPVVVPCVALILWLIGLSVYLPKPAAQYAAEAVRKRLGSGNDMVLICLDPRCYARRKDGSLDLWKLKSHTPLKTELADRLLDIMKNGCDAQALEELRGQPFTVKA